MTVLLGTCKLLVLVVDNAGNDVVVVVDVVVVFELLVREYKFSRVAGVSIAWFSTPALVSEPVKGWDGFFPAPGLDPSFFRELSPGFSEPLDTEICLNLFSVKP